MNSVYRLTICEEDVHPEKTKVTFSDFRNRNSHCAVMACPILDRGSMLLGDLCGILL